MNDCNNSFLYQYPAAPRAVINNNVDLQLFFKSLSLSDTRSLFNNIRNSKDTAVRRLFTQWQATRSLLAKQNGLPVDRRMSNIKDKEDEAESLEKELGRRSSEFRRQQNSLGVSIRDIQRNLGEDEAAIEFVSFKLYNRKATDSIIYAAYIIRKQDSTASFVPLFEENSLQKLLDSAGRTPTGVAKLFYRGAEVKASSSLTFDKQLYQLIWQPLEKKLNGIKKIAYSPSGKLYGIAFHALRIDSNSLLMDKYQLQQFTSTRDIAMRADRIAIKPGPIALFGSADFTMDSIALSKKKKDPAVAVNASLSRGSNVGAWPDLPGTGDEVKKIADLFRKNKISSKQFVHADASEENLKKAGGEAPAILHIATHGFFLPDRSGQEKGLETGNPYVFANDPLLRSGLILSGGNYVWSGKAPLEGVEDGIVTAYEIAQMDLSNTGLVVLSACETALGDIKGTEGVFGLQRAFKMAGVKKMIVSLWQVPDKETAELMTAFYNYWLNGRTVEDAFLQSQMDMRKKYSPFYWAAFVLIN
jgi:CHAT domain-containing protein